MDKNLRAFISVVERGNLKSAADHIGLTQPSITKRLQNMETQLGGPLFDRSGRGMTLTSAGRQFFERAKRIEKEYIQAREEIQNLMGAGMDVLRIGAGPLFYLQYLPTILATLHDEYPAVKFELHADINERTIPLLLAGRLDIVLGVLDQTLDESELMAIPVTTVEQAVILPAQSSLSGNASLSGLEIHQLSWILFGEDKSNEQWLINYFAKHRLGQPTIVLRTRAFSTGLQMVADGGFAMMAPIQLKPIVHTRGLQILPVTPALSQFKAGAYVRPSSMGFGLMQRIVELLKEAQDE